MDPGERARLIRRWRGPLLGLGVLGLLTVAGAAVLTLILLVVGLASMLTNFS
jgi:hypothetical protein